MPMVLGTAAGGPLHADSAAGFQLVGIFSTSPKESYRKPTATMFPTRALLGRSVWKGKLPVSIPRLLCHPLPKISR